MNPLIKFDQFMEIKPKNSFKTMQNPMTIKKLTSPSKTESTANTTVD